MDRLHEVPEKGGTGMRKRSRGETMSKIRRNTLGMKKDTPRMMKAKMNMRWG